MQEQEASSGRVRCLLRFATDTRAVDGTIQTLVGSVFDHDSNCSVTVKNNNNNNNNGVDNECEKFRREF